jgi:hypothetical protein
MTESNAHIVGEDSIQIHLIGMLKFVQRIKIGLNLDYEFF